MHIRGMWDAARTAQRPYMRRRRQVNGCRCRRRRSRYLYFSTPNSNRMKLYCIEFSSILFSRSSQRWWEIALGEREPTNRQDIVPFTFAKFIINEFIFCLARQDPLVVDVFVVGVLFFAAIAILCCIFVEREDVTKFCCLASHDIAYNNSFS